MVERSSVYSPAGSGTVAVVLRRNHNAFERKVILGKIDQIFRNILGYHNLLRICNKAEA